MPVLLTGDDGGQIILVQFGVFGLAGAVFGA
jgi:hypothetical protein